MNRLEYEVLRKITGAYQRRSNEGVLAIAHMRPRGIKLDDISISWAARGLRTGNPHIRKILDNPISDRARASHQKMLAKWYHGRGALCARKRPHPMAEAFYNTTI